MGFGLVTASVVAMAAMGFTLQFAISGIFNLTYGDVMTASAFSALLAAEAGLGLGPTLVVGGVTGAVVSLLLERGVFTPFLKRGTGLFGIVVVTIGASLILQNILQVVTKADLFHYPFRSQGRLRIAGMVFTDIQLEIIALTLVAVVVLHQALRRTKMGKAIRATAVNPELARSCGVSTKKVNDTTWLVSGALCGLGGVILAINIISFNFTTGSEFLVLLISAAVLGGVGHPIGATLGALVIGISSEMAATLVDPSYKLLVAFVILGVVLLTRPQGIMSDIAVRKNVVA
ncbi:MAG: branched-chain amino acid ABC transporter permease [Actinomycetota bacterium]